MADDMGLGKTLQALMFLAIMVETGKTESGQLILSRSITYGRIGKKNTKASRGPSQAHLQNYTAMV